MKQADKKELLLSALHTLQTALDTTMDDAFLVRDAAIQRFEFTFELCWKWLQKRLQEEGIDGRSPKQVLREAYALGWLTDEDLWLAMVQDRNLTSHTYIEEIAADVYKRLPAYAAAIQQLAASD